MRITEATNEIKIVTDFWLKPIPDRNHDWTAWDDDNPEIGSASGPTEQEAINNYREVYLNLPPLPNIFNDGVREMEWQEINPQYGWPTHKKELWSGKLRIIKAETARRIGQKDKLEPLWYGQINNLKIAPQFEEKTVMEIIDKLIVDNYPLPNSIDEADTKC